MNTSRQSAYDYDNPEKVTRKKQWREASFRPAHLRKEWDSIMYETHRKNLVMSYQCADKDITFDFRKITDPDDEDKNRCVYIEYFMKCIFHGEPTNRCISTIKIPVPEHIIRRAEELNANTKQITAAPIAATIEECGDRTTATGPYIAPVAPRPAVKRPTIVRPPGKK